MSAAPSSTCGPRCRPRGPRPGAAPGGDARAGGPPPSPEAAGARVVTDDGVCAGEEKGTLGASDTTRRRPPLASRARWARWYDPTLGRLLQPDWWDPLDPSVVLGGGLQGLRTSAVGANRYAYAGNDPINRSDPGGIGSRKIRSRHLVEWPIYWIARSKISISGLQFEVVSTVDYKYPFKLVYESRCEAPFMEIGISDIGNIIFTIYNKYDPVQLDMEDWILLKCTAEAFLTKVLADERGAGMDWDADNTWGLEGSTKVR